MRSRTRRGFQLLAALLIVLQLVPFLPAASAAGIAEVSGSLFTQVNNASYPVLTDTQTNYAASTGYQWDSATTNLPFLFTLSLPTGRDWKTENNYLLTLEASQDPIGTHGSAYEAIGMAPDSVQRSYKYPQPVLINYKRYKDFDNKKFAGSSATFTYLGYYVVPVKAAQNGIRWGDKGGSDIDRYSYYTDDELAAIRALFPAYLEKTEKLRALGKQILSQKELSVGSYHPQYGFMAQLKNTVGGSFENVLKMDQYAFCNLVVGRGLDVAQAEYYVNHVLDDVYDRISQERIDSPDFTSFEIAGSKARIDTEKHTITLNKPFGADWTAATPILTTNGHTEATLTRGSLKNGDRLYYTVTPYCPLTGMLYNGQKDVRGGVYMDLSEKRWTVVINPGTPFNDVTSFGVYDTKMGKMRYGTIYNSDTGVGGTITLNLPTYTDLKAIKPVVTSMGEFVSIQKDDGTWERLSESSTYDFSKERKIRVENATYDLKTEYTVTVTNNPSTECSILSYTIGYAEAKIDEAKKEINIEVPYGTDLSKAAPVVTTSDFASVSKPTSLAYDVPISYTVTAEDGKTTKVYTVRIKQTPAATGKSILSFSYGSISAKITGTNITLNVPFGTDVTALKPSIEVSPFATVSPQSDTAQNFTNPVQYIVTAQNGGTQTYTVTVKVADKPTDPPERDKLYRVRSNILASYKTTQAGPDHDGRVTFDDWVLMNLGFAERTGKPVTPGDPLPYGLDIYDQIAELSPKKMTDYARIIMMLTALGIDATKLDAYGDGEPFKDGSGKVVHNLVEELYKYNGSYTINGPIFALIALDMGNYTVPNGVKWTREKLLETILAHSYGSDGWGIDMVAMLMQSLYPYINDPTYGTQVKAKLQEGYDIILGYRSAPSVDPMGSDYSFYSWGTTNSESCAQVICAMCVMGVDVGYDPNFSDVANQQGVLYS